MIGSYVILASQTWVNDMRRKHVRLSKAGEEKFDMRTGSKEALGMSYREVAVKLLRSNCIRLRGRERTGRRGGKGWEKTGRDGRRRAGLGGDRALHSAESACNAYRDGVTKSSGESEGTVEMKK